MGVSEAPVSFAHSIRFLFRGGFTFAAALPKQSLDFGSVTQAVLAASTAPLPVLREGPPPRGASLRLDVAFDGSRHGLPAV